MKENLSNCKFVLTRKFTKASMNPCFILRLSSTSELTAASNKSKDDSNSNLQEIKDIKELNEEKRKSARRREFIMAELLETERSYVKGTFTNYFDRFLDFFDPPPSLVDSFT